MFAQKVQDVVLFAAGERFEVVQHEQCGLPRDQIVGALDLVVGARPDAVLFDEINQQALPTLISETLTAQSSDVDTVSGATYTSESYRASLQTAIDDARAAATA